MILEFITYRKWLTTTATLFTVLALLFAFIEIYPLSIFSGLIAIVLLKFTLIQYSFFRRLKIWIKRHNHETLLFYPCNKKRQKVIFNEVAPLLDNHHSIYYDGPKIVGDMKRSVVSELMRFYDLEVNKPALINVQDRNLIISPIKTEVDQYLGKKMNMQSLFQASTQDF